MQETPPDEAFKSETQIKFEQGSLKRLKGIKPKKPKLSTDEEEIKSIEDKVEIARLEKMPTMQK